MCGRYKRKTDKQAIATAFHVDGNLDDVILPAEDDIRPTTIQPIIRLNKDSGERDLVVGRPSERSAGSEREQQVESFCVRRSRWLRGDMVELQLPQLELGRRWRQGFRNGIRVLTLLNCGIGGFGSWEGIPSMILAKRMPSNSHSWELAQ